MKSIAFWALGLLIFSTAAIADSTTAIKSDDISTWPTCKSPNKPDIPDREKLMDPIFSGRNLCKNGCVAFHSSHNGTRRAHRPSSSMSRPLKCRVGQKCRICFEHTGGCVEAIYKGNAGKRWNFYLSPSFFEQTCDRNGLPDILKKECTDIVERTMKPTIYSDGYSCPEGCLIPHVVINKVHNGSPRAFHVNSSAENPKKCKTGQQCRICFKHGKECMNVKYMGTGPGAWRLDFPPVFYKENCDRNDIPATLKKTCRSMKRAEEKLGRNLNCFDNPTHPQCDELIRNAESQQEDDAKERKLCLRLGQKTFNARRPPSKQRIYACNYSKLSKQWEFPNRERRCVRRPKWKLLLPGACPQGTLVGKFGLNCCGKDLFSSAAVGSGCRMYFPKPEPQPLSTPQKVSAIR